MGTKAGTSFGRPGPDNAAVEVLARALPRSAPKALAALRDTSPEQSAITQWARDHHLASAIVIRNAVQIRKDWEDRPDRAATLTVVPWVTVYGVYAPDAPERPKDPYEQWAEDNEGTLNSLPHPHIETLEQWLTRAKEMYLERAALRPELTERRWYLHWDQFRQHCQWFVDVQVNGHHPRELARKVYVTGDAVDKATRKIAALLGVRRRQWPTFGRPPSPRSRKIE